MKMNQDSQLFSHDYLRAFYKHKNKNTLLLALFFVNLLDKIMREAISLRFIDKMDANRI